MSQTYQTYTLVDRASGKAITQVARDEPSHGPGGYYDDEVIVRDPTHAESERYPRCRYVYVGCEMAASAEDDDTCGNCGEYGHDVHACCSEDEVDLVPIPAAA